MYVVCGMFTPTQCCSWVYDTYYNYGCNMLQVDQMLRGAPVDSAGNFDYNAFTRILKHGTKDE